MQESTSQTTVLAFKPNSSVYLVDGQCSFLPHGSHFLSFQPDTYSMNRWGTKRIRINQVYQEYISDKQHLHMNATRWLSLTEFCKHLGRSGLAHVDETEKGWFISWIDSSPKALAKAEANQKKERGDMDDETRQRKLIQEQIERARREGERRRIEAAGGTWSGETDDAPEVAEEEEPVVNRELKREDGEKVSLSLSFKMKPAEVPAPTTTTATSGDEGLSTSDSTATETLPSPPSTTITTTTPSTGFVPLPSSNPATTVFSAKPNVFKSNLLKRPNPLKGSSSGASSTSSNKRPAAPMSAVESIFQEEMARKNRVGGQPWNGGVDGLQHKKPRTY